MLNIVRTCIIDNSLIKAGQTIIIGLSGGPDSVCMTHLLAQLAPSIGFTVIAAHFDHQWRSDSALDAQFCEQFCKTLNIKFIAGQADTITVEHKKTGSAEADARNLRRSFLESIAREHQAESIALAHHQQDQHETFLIRLIRGATIAGLASMRIHHGNYIRPLLTCTKEQILAYLQEHNLQFRQDPSNNSQSFLRNRIRTNVIPALQACDARFAHNANNTIAAIQQADSFLERIVHSAYQQVSVTQYSNDSSPSTRLSVSKLQQLDSFLHKRIVLHWLIAHEVPFTVSDKFLSEVTRFLFRPSGGKHSLHPEWYINKKQGWCTINR
jgi:tRNA(Ile)-lysidine synthase